MDRQRIFQFCILSCILLIQVKSQSGFCIFGPYTNCLLPCRCSSTCNKITGHCSDGQCAEDPFLKNQELDGHGRTYWTGDACQTGDVGRGKNAEQIGTYYNPGFKINATADKAVDGNISSYAYSRTFSYGWWMVDLGVEHEIEEVYITANNLGNSIILLTNYSVWMGNGTDVFTHSLCGLAPSPLVPGYSYSPVTWNKVTCDHTRRGRYLSIRKTENDSSKGFIPIHEAIIIGYPVSSVRLGYCIKYDEAFWGDLKNLKCLQCAEGWSLPECRNPSSGNVQTKAITSSTTISTSSTTTSTSSTATSSPSATTYIPVTQYSTTSQSSNLKTSTDLNTPPSTSHTTLGGRGTSSMETESTLLGVHRGSSASTWLIIGTSFAVLVALLLIAIVIVIVVCCRRKGLQKSQIPAQNIQGPIYFKPHEENVSAVHPNYEGLRRYNISPNAYAGVRPTGEDDENGYQTIPIDDNICRYTNLLHEGDGQNVDSNAYQNTDTFADNKGEYLEPRQSVKVGENNEGYIELIKEQRSNNDDNNLYHTVNTGGVNIHN